MPVARATDPAVEAAAAVSGVAEITSSVGESTVPQVQLIPGC